jgi:deoxyadenosine/deoxycytidine kinase
MYIAIEGSIGAGKTTFAKSLSYELMASIVLEDFAQNPFLEDFYSSPKTYAFQNQLAFLLIHYNQLQKAGLTTNPEKPVISDFTLDKEKVFTRLNLEDIEYSLFLLIYEYLFKQIVRPQILIFLYAPLGILLTRLKERGREMELKIDEGYYTSFNNAFAQFYSDYMEKKIAIDTSQYDIVKDPSLLPSIIEMIEDIK